MGDTPGRRSGMSVAGLLGMVAAMVPPSTVAVQLGPTKRDKCIGECLGRCACGAELDSCDRRYYQGSRAVRLLAAGWNESGTRCPACRRAEVQP